MIEYIALSDAVPQEFRLTFLISEVTNESAAY